MIRLFALVAVLAALLAAGAGAQTVIPGSQLPLASPSPGDVLFGIHGGTYGVGGTTSKFIYGLSPSMNVPGFVAPGSIPTPVGTASASPNIAVGYQQDGHVIAFSSAFDNNPYGGRVSGFGYGAMKNESLYAFEEAAFGWNALEYSNEGQWNVAIGPEAMRYLGSNGTFFGGLNAAQNNVAVGPQALLSLCSISASAPNGATPCTTTNQGTNNVAIGEEVMYLASTAANDTGVGQNALFNISTGSNNVGVGANAMNLMTTGNFNEGIGVTALGNATTAQFSVAVGFDADYSSNASYDTFVGTDAGYTGSGGQNVGIGYQALYGETSGGSDNTALGDAAGSSVTSGTRLTLLGYNAQAQGATDTTEIVIGYGATGAGSNTATIGNSSVKSLYLGGGGGIIMLSGAASGACSPNPIGTIGVRTDSGAAAGSEVYVCRNVSGTGTWEALSGG